MRIVRLSRTWREKAQIRRTPHLPDLLGKSWVGTGEYTKGRTRCDFAFLSFVTFVYFVVRKVFPLKTVETIVLGLTSDFSRL